MRRQWIHGDSNRPETPICLWRTIAFVRVVVVTTVWHLVALQLFSNTVLSVFAPKTTALVYNHKHTNTHSTHHRHRFITPIIMVARSSIARTRLPLYFTAVYFFIFSLATLSQTSENRYPRNFPTRRGLVFNRTFAMAISSKCPLKRTGPKNTKFVPFFVPSRRQLAP